MVKRPATQRTIPTSPIERLQKSPKLLGPLSPLVGIWEGEKGYDLAPSPSREKEDTAFRERMTFEPLPPVQNHEQTLQGLRYSTLAWPVGSADPFHEDRGYWLWDPATKEIVRCFVIPRGITVLAKGHAEPDAHSFELVAEASSGVNGICSSPFLEREFKTLSFRLRLTIHDERSFSYEQESVLQIRGQHGTFSHVDKNTLKKV